MRPVFVYKKYSQYFKNVKRVACLDIKNNKEALQMCTNTALVNSLECYMDDLVESFEDFVKKSLILIAIAAATVIGMLVYALKKITQQTQMSNRGVSPDCPILCTMRESVDNMDHRSVHKVRSSETLLTHRLESMKNDYMMQKDRNVAKATSANVQYGPPSFAPSLDEQLLLDIGLSSSSKNCCTSNRRVKRNCSASRLTLPSLPACMTKQHLSTSRPCSRYLGGRKSCCSMCCDFDRL